MLELVVARYAEDLRWLRKVPADLAVTIYNKGPELAEELPVLRREPHVASLPNVGREAHTYLHHLASCYSRLAPHTVFCQGKPFDHVFDFHRQLKEFVLAETLPDFAWLGHIVDTDDRLGRTLYVPWSKNPDQTELDMDGCHQALFGAPGPRQYTFRLGGQFLVSREVVWRRPRSFWVNAAHVAASFPDAAHCLERMWDRVFEQEAIPPQWQGRTVYLKPVKRLESPNSEGSA